MILVDTSIWIDHLRVGDFRLTSSLNAGLVYMHPFVLGELACGNLRNRAEVLDLLAELPCVPVATEAEVLRLIERRGLAGRGIGYIDVHLLASAAFVTTRLWTRDKRLAAVAADMGVGSA